MKKKLTICNVITGLSVGGAEMMLLKLISNLDRQVFNPIVVSLVNKGQIGEKLEKLGIEVYSLNLKSLLDGPKAIVSFLKILNQLKPDLIQGWMYHGNLFALTSYLYSIKVPILWNIRGSHYCLKKEKKLTAFVIWLGAKLSFAPIKIINNSKHSAEKHVEILGFNNNKTIIIPNGFDTELFKPSEYYRNIFRKEMNFTDEDIVVGLIGRYNPVKGHDLFIKAAHQLTKQKCFKNIKFILIGHKVDYSNEFLAQTIRNYGLEKSFYLLGQRDNLHTIIPSLDIVVSSSYSEGFSNVIGEAMSCGVPCVVTDVGDSKWIVGDTGIVVPPNNVEALVDGIEYMLNLPKTEREKMGMAARKRIIDNFSIDLIVKKYEALYKEIISNRRMI